MSSTRNSLAATPPSSSAPTHQAATLPPFYTDILAAMSSLLHGDSQETISVPMVHSHESTRLRDVLIPFNRGRGRGVTRTIVVRRMTREHSTKHYARDALGTYLGTEKVTVGAGLVFVPSQSSSQELLEQVRKGAFGTEHSQGAFQVGYAMESRRTEERERGV